MISWLGSLRVRFLLLVLFALLPALGLLLYVASGQRDQAVEDAQEDARRLAGLAAADQERQLVSTRQLLVALTALPTVREGDPAACSALLATLRAEVPLYANLGVIEPDGNLRCSAVPPTGPTNLGDRGYFRRAVETRAFVVGEYQLGRITGLPTINCGYPVIDEAGQVLAVVYAALDLNWLNDFAAEAGLPEGSVLTVVDRAGTVLVHHPDPAEEGWVGRSLAGTPVVDTILTEGAGTAEAPGADGRTYLYAFEPLAIGTAGSAYVIVAIPRATAVAPAERAFGESLTRLGLVATLVLVAAWVGADLLVRRDLDANKALVRRLYDAFETGGVDPLDEVVAPDFVDHDPLPGQAPGLVGMKQAVGLFRAAFPDGRLAVEELIAEGDKVVARVRLRGTQAGAFFDVEPSGRPMTAEGTETYRIAGGKIAESWSRLGPLMHTAGLPEPAPEVADEATPRSD